MRRKTRRGDALVRKMRRTTRRGDALVRKMRRKTRIMIVSEK